MDGSNINSGDLLRAFTSAMANGAASKPSAEFDVAEFLHLLDAIDAAESEKLELLSIIANIMEAFVDMGFGIHPVQQACGQVAEGEGDRCEQDSEMLKSEFSERKNE